MTRARPRKRQDGPVKAWFADWLNYHQHLCRHAAWKNYDSTSEAGSHFFEAWIEAFAELQVTLAEAGRVSREMQRTHPGLFPEHHLGAIAATIGALRAADHQARVAAAQAERQAELAESRERHDSARAAWEALPPAEREARTQAVIADNPSLARIRSFAQAAAFHRWAEEQEVTG